jgi:hypothetical protein
MNLMTNMVSTLLITLFDQVQDARDSGIFIFSLPSIYIQEGGNRIRLNMKPDMIAPSAFYYQSRNHPAFDNLRSGSGRQQ